MSETILAAIIGVFGTIVGGLVVWFIALRKLKSEIEVLDTQADVSESQAAINITVAADKGMSIVKSAMEFQEQQRLKEREELTADIKRATDALLQASAENNKMADRVRELEESRHAYREEQEARTTTLENNVRDLLVKSNEWETRYQALQEQYNSLKDRYNKAIELLVGVLDVTAREKVMPELALLLGDSVTKFRLPKPGKQ